MLTLILGIAAALVLLAALVRWLEPRFAFFPMTGESITPRDFNAAYERLTIETRDGERLHAWVIANTTARARILYFHGNGGNMSSWVPIVAAIAAHDCAVLIFDYRGYGLSTGRPTEQGLHRDVDAVIERFWRQASNAVPMVYWGRSLGVAMASYGATVREPDGLILESGYPDARALLRNSPILWLLAHVSSYRFSAVASLHRLKSAVPTLVMHGDHDRIVPIAQGQALFSAIAEPKEFVTLRGGDHNDLTPSDPETYWRAIDEFIDRLRKVNAVRAPVESDDATRIDRPGRR